MNVAKAPGKMIMLGEYAVLEGAPALVAAVDRFAKVQTRPGKSSEFVVQSPSLNVERQLFVMTEKGGLRFDPQNESTILRKLGFFSKVFENLCQLFKESGISIPAQELSLNTDDFYSGSLQTKLGFGSSAALTVALTLAISTTVDRNLDKDAIFKFALQAHRGAQGNLGSGIDVAASVYGGTLIYEMTQPQKPPVVVDNCDELFITPVWIGHSTSTRKMVRGVDRLKENQPGVYQSLISQMSDVSSAGCRAYENKNVPAFILSVKEFNELMSELGRASGMDIVSPEHQKIVKLAVGEGQAYKPSGAGGGDIGVAFCDSRDKLEMLRQKIKEAGFYPLPVSTAFNGVELIK